MKPKISLLSLLALLCLVLILAGCGGGDAAPTAVADQPKPIATAATATSKPAAAALDPCALLTPDEVAQAVGVPVGAPTSEADALSGAVTCTFTFRKDPDVEGALWLHTWRQAIPWPTATSPLTLPACLQKRKDTARIP